MPLSEEEIRPEALMAEQARLFAEDTVRLMQGRADFEWLPCPACDGLDATPTFEKSGMAFVRCAHCETIYANPRPTAVQLAAYYRTSQNYEFWSRCIFPASEASRREKIFQPRVERILSLCEQYAVPTHLLLEVGAGFGIFCEEMQKTGRFQQVVAVEPTPHLAEHCRNRQLTVIEQPIEQVQRSQICRTQEESISLIASFEVIEHLHTPRAFIRQCADLLEPGGVLAMSCPNSQGFDIILLQERSSAVDVEHLNLFNPKSLALLVESCGLEVLDVQTPGLLDAELVRKQLLSGALDAAQHSFFQQVLVREWETSGAAFQRFLMENRLSSHLWLLARKRL